MCIYEIEAFLEFQAKINKKNPTKGQNVKLWAHFQPASMEKVQLWLSANLAQCVFHLLHDGVASH
jgi:hypothetical protein